MTSQITRTRKDTRTGRRQRWLRDGQPDWSAISFDVFCPRCGHDLRGVGPAHCPECSAPFEWLHLLRRSAFGNDCLFELHCPHRPVRSWLVTVGRALRPSRFWRSVQVTDRVQPTRLWLLLLLAAGAFFAALQLGVAAVWGLVQLGFRAIDVLVGGTGAAVASGTPGLIGWEINASLLQHAGLVVGLPLLALMLVVGVAWALRWVSTRDGLGWGHVLRVVAHTATPVCLVWAALITGGFALKMVHAAMAGLGRGSVEWGTAAHVAGYLLQAYPVVLAVVMPLVPAMYLAAGLKRYLVVSRPWLIAGLTVSLAGLAMVLALYPWLPVDELPAVAREFFHETAVLSFASAL